MPRRRLMPPAHRATMGCSLVLILGLGSEAAAQSLDLDDRPAAPELTRSVLDDIAERCAEDGGDRRNETDSHTAVVTEAGRNLRRIAVELANRGVGTGDAAMVAGLMAIRLSASLSEIDDLLDSLARPGTFVGYRRPGRRGVGPRGPAARRRRSLAGGGRAIVRRLAFWRRHCDLCRRARPR